MIYREDEMLRLSGIQHYVFCPRQWALIYLDQQWEENYLTLEGRFLHKNADDIDYRICVGDKAFLHHVALSSQYLGLYGYSDVIELRKPSGHDINGVFVPHLKAHYSLYPIEYKHGAPKSDLCDILQLTAQIMCLEEKHGITIPEGALFYWKTRRRLPVTITAELRDETKRVSDEMHSAISIGQLPKPSRNINSCQRCSLIEICRPQDFELPTPKKYIQDNLL